MATETYYFKGKVKWAKVYPGQEKSKFGDRFTVDFYPDDVAAFVATGVQLVAKKDDDGAVKFQVRREPQKLIRGELVNFGPPQVLDKNNNPTTVAIGNGSTVTIKIAVYDTMKGKGHRLDAVRIEDLVVYNSEGGAGDGKPKGEVPKLPF